METLNTYTHNLAGKEISYDSGRWSAGGQWRREVYRVNSDNTVQHVSTRNFWSTVEGETEYHDGGRFVPDCDGETIYIAGEPCILPRDAEFNKQPTNTMNTTPQKYCQLQTMSNLLMEIEGSKPVSLYDQGTGYHGVGIQIDGMDYMTILFERNGSCGVTYNVDGYTGSRTWRTTNAYHNGIKEDGSHNYEFRQRTEEELCAEVIKEVNSISENCS